MSSILEANILLSAVSSAIVHLQCGAAVADYLTPELEGAAVATKLLTVLKSGLHQDDQVSAFADAVGDLIDISWNNLDATQERLKGFSSVIIAAMATDVPVLTMDGAVNIPEFRKDRCKNQAEMARNIARLKGKPAKKKQAHLLCTSLSALLKGGAQ